MRYPCEIYATVKGMVFRQFSLGYDIDIRLSTENRVLYPEF